jgi:hypothetical protein
MEGKFLEEIYTVIKYFIKQKKSQSMTMEPTIMVDATPQQ